MLLTSVDIAIINWKEANPVASLIVTLIVVAISLCSAGFVFTHPKVFGGETMND